VIFQSFLLRFGRDFRRFIPRKLFYIVVLTSIKELRCYFVAEELSTSYLVKDCCGIEKEFVGERVSIIIWLFVEESINDSIPVDLGTCNTGAIGNNDLEIAVQR